MILSPDQLAQVKQLTDRAYHHLHPDVRLYLNEQLLECTAGWQVEEWIERLKLTAEHYEGKAPHGLGGPVTTKATIRRRKVQR